MHRLLTSTPRSYVTSRLWRHRVLPGHEETQPTGTVSLAFQDVTTLPQSNAAAGPTATPSHRASLSSSGTVLAGYPLRPEDAAEGNRSPLPRNAGTGTGTSGAAPSPKTQVINPWFCVALLLAAVGFMIPTAEFVGGHCRMGSGRWLTSPTARVEHRGRS